MVTSESSRRVRKGTSLVPRTREILEILNQCLEESGVRLSRCKLYSGVKTWASWGNRSTSLAFPQRILISLIEALGFEDSLWTRVSWTGSHQIECCLRFGESQNALLAHMACKLQASTQTTRLEASDNFGTLAMSFLEVEAFSERAKY